MASMTTLPIRTSSAPVTRTHQKARKTSTVSPSAEQSPHGDRSISNATDPTPATNDFFTQLDAAVQLDSISSRILMAVQYGQMNELRHLFLTVLNAGDDRDGGNRLPFFVANSSRNAKDTFIFALSQVSFAANRGGVPSRVTSPLTQEYIYRIESMTSWQEVANSIAPMMMKFCELAHQYQLPSSDSITVHRIYAFIHDNLTESISTADIAHALSLSPSYISRLFAAETGMTITHFLHHQRIHEAQYLLTTTSNSLTDIAKYLGYSSPQKFHLWFKRIAGVTPRQFVKLNNN